MRWKEYESVNHFFLALPGPKTTPCNQQTSSLPMSATRVPLLHLLLVHRRHQISSRQAQAFRVCAKISKLAHAAMPSNHPRNHQKPSSCDILWHLEHLKYSQIMIFWAEPVCGWHHRTSWRPNHWDASQVQVVTERERAVIATVSPSCPAAKWSLSRIGTANSRLVVTHSFNVNRQPLQPHEFSSIITLINQVTTKRQAHEHLVFLTLL